MKKDYVKPRMIVIDIESREELLQSSYVDIGGTTNKFNARRGYIYFDDDDLEEEL